MKKQYINADVKIIALDSNDIIATSGVDKGGQWPSDQGTPTPQSLDFELEEEEI